MPSLNLDDSKASGAAEPTRFIPSLEEAANQDLPMLYVTRYCALAPASLAAAVHDALAVLATYAARHPETACSSPVVAYRNKRGMTVTIDVGLPLDHQPLSPVAGEFRLGTTPAAVSLDEQESSFGELLKAGAELAPVSALRLPAAGQIVAGAAVTTTHCTRAHDVLHWRNHDVPGHHHLITAYLRPPTAVDAPSQSCLEAKDGLLFAQLLTSAFRNHPHINNVLTHISLGQWDRIEAALGNLLTAPIDTAPVSPLERNLLCLLWEEGGITGRVVKPFFLDICRTSLPPSLAARCVAGIDALSSLASEADA